MEKKDLLKNKLIEIKNNNWNIPEGIDKFELVLDMLENIGPIDMFLRDKLIYNVLNRELIENKKLSTSEMKKLLNLCLTEEHLFYGVDKVEDDSVFNRTFTMLAIDSIMRVNNEENMKFLNKDEVLDVYDKVINYIVQEKDLRGYVDVKGWAHSTAHAADCLCNFAECEFIGHKELLEILNS